MRNRCHKNKKTSGPSPSVTITAVIAIIIRKNILKKSPKKLCCPGQGPEEMSRYQKTGGQAHVWAEQNQPVQQIKFQPSGMKVDTLDRALLEEWWNIPKYKHKHTTHGSPPPWWSIEVLSLNRNESLQSCMVWICKCKPVPEKNKICPNELPTCELFIVCELSLQSNGLLNFLQTERKISSILAPCQLTYRYLDISKMGLALRIVWLTARSVWNSTSKKIQHPHIALDASLHNPVDLWPVINPFATKQDAATQKRTRPAFSRSFNQLSNNEPNNTKSLQSTAHQNT